MEKAIRRQMLPDMDSVEDLAKFWDTHDLTDFEADLEEAGEPVFVRAMGTFLSVELRPSEAQQLKRIARSKRVKESTMVRQWILERLHASSLTPRTSGNALLTTPRKTRRGRTANL